MIVYILGGDAMKTGISSWIISQKAQLDIKNKNDTISL